MGPAQTGLMQGRGDQRDCYHDYARMAVMEQRRERDMATDGNIAGTERTIKASEFKARCLKLMDEVAESGEESGL